MFQKSATYLEKPELRDIVIIDSRTHRERSWMDDLTEPLDNYIAIFEHSTQGHNIWVKRVIGKPGDKLEFHDGHVYRNGEKLDEPYINEPMEFSMDGSYTVPEGDVFVMGTTGTTALTAVSSGRFRSIMSLARYACSCNPVRHTASMRFLIHEIPVIR